MPDKSSNLDNSIIKALKSLGFILPKTEDEVESFEEAIKEHDIPTIPDELNSSDNVLKKGYSDPNNKILPIEDQEVSSNLARAARFGNKMPQSVLDKMKKDREDAENGKK